MKPKFVTNITKKEVAKLLKKRGFVAYNGNDDWCIPSDYVDYWHGRCFSMGNKYLSYAVDYKISEDNENIYGICMVRDCDAKIPFKMIPLEMLEELIDKVWQLYEHAQVHLKKAKASLVIRKAQEDFK